MNKLRLLSGVSVTVLSCNLTGVVVQAGPVRPTVKSVVYKMVGGIQVSPYDLNQRSSSSRRSSPSPSLISQDDGQLPTTSSSIFASSSLRSVVATSKQEASVSAEKSDSVGAVRRTRRYARVGEVEIGESVYLPTYDEGFKVYGAPPRPHLILKVEKNKYYSNSSDITIADLSRVSGKEYKVHHREYHVINDPNFTGDDASFVKFDKMKLITYPNNKKLKMLGKKVNDEELKIIKQKAGIKD